MDDTAELLQRTVIEGGYCIGCGACAVGAAAPFRIDENPAGFLGAVPKSRVNTISCTRSDLRSICPHSGIGADETMIARDLFGSDASWDDEVGYWKYLVAGHVTDAADRMRGSSGGLVTWLLRQLLSKRLVDHVVHVKKGTGGTNKTKRLFEYGFSSNSEELESGRGSAYYPIEMSAVLERIRATPGRYAVVALPCFAKAIRLLCAQDPILKERITVVVGIVCGHLKSRLYGDYLGWMSGVSPDNLKRIQFRTKLEGDSASQYCATFSTESGACVSHSMHRYFGTMWELGFMKYQACDFCDDVFAETADIVFGDAWFPPFIADWMGNNVVVSRRDELSALLERGQATGELELNAVNLHEVIASQAGGIRHRREGLGYRLAQTDHTGHWRPRKRVEPTRVSPDRESIYRYRSLLAALSSRAFVSARRLGHISIFYAVMTPPTFRYLNMRYGLKRAVLETAAVKAVRRLLSRTRRANALAKDAPDASSARRRQT